GLASGFQAAQGAAALFGQEGEAIQKTLLKVQAASAFAEGIKGVAGLSDGFKVLGNVIKANPVLLIAGIIAGIGAALFALKDKIGFIGAAFDAVGKVISFVTDKITALTDAIGLTDVAMTKTADSIISSSKRIQEATTSRYDSEIAAAKRAGKDTELLEIQKLQAITKTNDAVITQLRLRQQAQGELSAEDKKELDERVSQNRKAYQDILSLSDAYKDREIENNKKVTTDWEAEHHKKLAARKQYLADINAAEIAARVSMQEFLAERKAEEDAQILADNEAKYAAMDAETAKYFEESEKRKQKNAELKQSEKDAINNNLKIAQVSNDSMMALSDLYFTVKRNNLKKGSKEDLAAAKQQFEINKKLSLVSATIMGIQSVIAAYQSGAAVPVAGIVLGPAMAILAGIAAATNIAKIAGSKFEGGSPSVTGSTPTVSAPSISAPTINAPNSGNTALNADGTVKQNKENATRVYVLEHDISKTQKNVASIEQNAKL
ncbi:MAG TPA: hypothetical protein VGB71_16460, partial [Flavisolibacter sp.]